MREETKKKLGDWMQFRAFQDLDPIGQELGQLYAVKKIYPEAKNIFRAFEYTQYKNLKMVVLGQDPYNNTFISRRDGITTLPYTTGVAFGNSPLVPAISPSLKLIKKSVVECGYILLEDDLTGWAKQGVLMLNSALTVEANLPNSHQKLWEPFMQNLLKEISDTTPGMIYILIGNRAKSFEPYLNSVTSNVLSCEHPEKALSENRDWRSEQIWKTANELLFKISKEWIRW